MEIAIHKLGLLDIHQVNQFHRKFTVTSKLVFGVENEKLTYTIISVLPYEKEMAADDVDVMSFINNNEKTIFIADVNDGLAGRVKVIKWWNQFAYIDDLIVNPEFRRQGVGHALIERTIKWAKEKGFPGLMLETQNNNVAACCLYESCGFELSGFDRNLYKGLNPATDEIALYWYLIF